MSRLRLAITICWHAKLVNFSEKNKRVSVLCTIFNRLCAAVIKGYLVVWSTIDRVFKIREF